MIPAIDSYSWHRWFGWHYPDLEQPAAPRLDLAGLVGRTLALGARGVAIESCFFPDANEKWAARAADRLDAAGLHRVWAWGHPRGLSSGRDPDALDELMRHVGIARRLGAGVMRICAGGRTTRPDRWSDHKAALVPMLRRAADHAGQNGVVLAIENHIDFLADELVELLDIVASPALGVCLDTGNQLRMLEDPLEAALKLVPHAHTTHIKDITAWRGDPRTFAFWPSVAAGQGIIPLEAILGALRQAGYDGLLALEIDYLKPGGGDEDRALAEGLAYLARTL